MSTVNPIFADLWAAGRDELHAFIPETVAHQVAPIINAFASLIAMSRADLSIRSRENTLCANFVCRPAPSDNPDAQSLLDLAEKAMNESLAFPNQFLSFPLPDWVDRHGFLRLMTLLVHANVPLDRMTALAVFLGNHVQALNERLRELGNDHHQAIVRRDLGDVPRTASLNAVKHWALAPDLAGRDERKEALLRRRQALNAYAAIASELIEPEVTETIDNGLPLNRCLMARLGVGEPHLRALRGLRPANDALTDRRDYMPVVRTLLLHEVPLHQWPKAKEWKNSIWQDYFGNGLLRPDYIARSTERRDAFDAATEDLLTPLAAARAAALGLDTHNSIRYFLRCLCVPNNLAHSARHRDFLRAIRETIIGPRGIKAFDEATKRWHRRAATIAALRHEERADAPGWPGLCPIWNHPDGAYSFHALTSAQDLVDEGTALGHCVGGYYSQCRTGYTQILSLRRAARRRATLELHVEPGQGGGLSIKLGQFKAYGNSRPDPIDYDVLRVFLEDLRARRHPVSTKEIRAYRHKQARLFDDAWSRGPLPIDHARRAWPLYRTFLPKGLPKSYDDWSEATGLNAVFDMILTAIAQSTPEQRPNSNSSETAI